MGIYLILPSGNIISDRLPFVNSFDGQKKQIPPAMGGFCGVIIDFVQREGFVAALTIILEPNYQTAYIREAQS